LKYIIIAGLEILRKRRKLIHPSSVKKYDMLTLQNYSKALLIFNVFEISLNQTRMTRIKRMHTDTNDRILVFDQKRDTKMLHAELT